MSLKNLFFTKHMGPFKGQILWLREKLEPNQKNIKQNTFHKQSDDDVVLSPSRNPKSKFSVL